MNRFKSFESCTTFCSPSSADQARPAAPAPSYPSPSTTNENEIDVGPTATPYKPSPYDVDQCAEANANCRAISCPYGIERSTSNNGCDECRCYEPCRGYSCPEGTECQAELVRDESDPNQSATRIQPACRQINKEGRCPTVQRGSSSCEEECRSDANCQGDHKCCFNGCGRSCLPPAPLYEEPTTTTPSPVRGTPPRIIDGESRVAAEEGSVGEMQCEAVGSPKPTIYWRRANGEAVNDEGKFKIQSNGSLLIIGVHRSDAGMYTCIADNGVGSSALKQVQFEVKVAPSARAWSERSNYPVDSDIQIHCEVQGQPLPQVTWYKDNNQVVSTDRITITGNNTLMITGAEGADSGSYRCEAVNLLGDSSSLISIVVEGVYLHPNCTDNPFFANCKLIVKARFCTNKYYARFCCKSCTLAGQLPATGPHLLDYKTGTSSASARRRK